MSEEYNASEIDVLTGLEPVRKRPSMYLGDLSNPNLTTRLAFQTLCHAIDESIEGNCNSILMNVGKSKITTTYNAGLPLDPHPAAEGLPAAIMFLSLHMACHNQKKNLEVGSELCELGLAVLNGVCSKLVATVVHREKTAKFIFEKGKLTNSPKLSDTSSPDSTEITAELDPSILPNTDFCITKIRTEAKRILGQYNISVSLKETS